MFFFLLFLLSYLIKSVIFLKITFSYFQLFCMSLHIFFFYFLLNFISVLQYITFTLLSFHNIHTLSSITCWIHVKYSFYASSFSSILPDLFLIFLLYPVPLFRIQSITILCLDGPFSLPCTFLYLFSIIFFFYSLPLSYLLFSLAHFVKTFPFIYFYFRYRCLFSYYFFLVTFHTPFIDRGQLFFLPKSFSFVKLNHIPFTISLPLPLILLINVRPLSSSHSSILSTELPIILTYTHFHSLPLPSFHPFNPSP